MVQKRHLVRFEATVCESVAGYNDENVCQRSGVGRFCCCGATPSAFPFASPIAIVISAAVGALMFIAHARVLRVRYRRSNVIEGGTAKWRCCRDTSLSALRHLR
jgi:hypothetical protein